MAFLSGVVGYRAPAQAEEQAGGSRAGRSLEEWCLLVLPEHLAGSAPHHLSQMKLFVITLEEENAAGRGFALW